MTALFLLLAAQASAPASIQGMWRSPGGNSIISIAPCGSSLCGTVAWASEQAKRASIKATDQLVGTQLLTNLRQGKEGRWQGKLFIPDKAMRVTAKIQLVSDQQLKVSGCIAGKACAGPIFGPGQPTRCPQATNLARDFHRTAT